MDTPKERSVPPHQARQQWPTSYAPVDLSHGSLLQGCWSCNSVQEVPNFLAKEPSPIDEGFDEKRSDGRPTLPFWDVDRQLCVPAFRTGEPFQWPSEHESVVIPNDIAALKSVKSSGSLFVHLGPLERAGKIAVNHLPFGVQIQRSAAPARLPRTASGRLGPAEGQLDLRADR
jgi:hypothetical protein